MPTSDDAEEALRGFAQRTMARRLGYAPPPPTLSPTEALRNFYQRVSPESESPAAARKVPESMVTRTTQQSPLSGFRRPEEKKRDDDVVAPEPTNCWCESTSATVQTAPPAEGQRHYCYRALRYTYIRMGDHGSWSDREAFRAKSDDGCTPGNPINWFFTPGGDTLDGLLALMMQPPPASLTSAARVTFYFDCGRSWNRVAGKKKPTTGEEGGSISLYGICYSTG